MTQIFATYADFLSRPDKTVNGCSPDHYRQDDSQEAGENCEGCWNCSYCSRCSDCSDCFGRKDSGSNVLLEIPIIFNIHQRVAEACRPDGALGMHDWHTCETTHCRAGWVVRLAGEAGKRLEDATSTLFAAMQIYHASSPIKVSLLRFYDTNSIAMEDIERCAAEEAKAAV